MKTFLILLIAYTLGFQLGHTPEPIFHDYYAPISIASTTNFGDNEAMHAVNNNLKLNY